MFIGVVFFFNLNRGTTVIEILKISAFFSKHVEVLFRLLQIDYVAHFILHTLKLATLK